MSKLLDEPEFSNNLHLHAIRDVNPKNEHFLAIFVYDAESQSDGTLLLRPISTTVAGIQRYATKRLSYQGIYIAREVTKDQIPFETLRAHFRAEALDLMERMSSTYGPKLRWTKWFASGAGDLDKLAEFVIEDPDVADLNALFNLGQEGYTPDDEE
jgi:hypothetical protein